MSDKDEKKDGGEEKKEATNVAAALLSKLPVEELRAPTREAARTIETLLLAVQRPLSKLRRWAIEGRYEDEEFEQRLKEKTRHIPEEQLALPAPQTVIEVIDGYILNEDEPSLQEMFLNLLAASMDGQKRDYVRSAFTATLKQLNADEACILNLFSTESYLAVVDIHKVRRYESALETPVRINFSVIGTDAKCVAPQHTSIYISNLVKLGLLEKSAVSRASLFERYQDADRVRRRPNLLGHKFSDIFEIPELYEIIGFQWSQEIMERLMSLEDAPFFEPRAAESGYFLRKYALILSDFGASFCNVCLPLPDKTVPDPRLSGYMRPNTDLRYLAREIASEEASDAASNVDVSSAISDYSSDVDGRLDAMQNQIDGLAGQIEDIEKQVISVESDFQTIRDGN